MKDPNTTSSSPSGSSTPPLANMINAAKVEDDGRVSLLDLPLPPPYRESTDASSYESLYKPQDPAVSHADRTTPTAIPRLSIVIQIVGSRGDVQPYVALAKELQTYGHRARLATHETFRGFVRNNGVEFYPLAGDPAELMAYMVEANGILPSVNSVVRGDVGKRRKTIAAILKSTWASCIEPDEETGRPFRADAIIANPVSFGHIHCAERLGIPLHMSFTMPWSPTGSFPHPMTTIDHSKAVRKRLNKFSYDFMEQLTWAGLGDLMNEFRTDVLKLRPMTRQQGTTALVELKVPYTYCWSPSLIPKPIDWEDHVDITGFYFLNLASNYTPPADLQTFLSSGPPPIYIGFGSITGYDPAKLTAAILEGVKLSGVRAIISKGWAGLGSDSTLQSDPSIFYLGDCPHDWLFQHVSAVCHHGGAGTLSAGIRCGKPTIVVPFFGDQFFWGAMVYRMKAGPLPIPAKELTPQKLASAIQEALSPEMVAKAQEIASGMARETGTRSGAASFHRHLPVDTMRSDLNPTHAASLYIPSRKLKVSRNVAQVLACAGAITESDLQFYETKKWIIPDDKDNVLGYGFVSGAYQGVSALFSENAKGIKKATEASTAKGKAVAVVEGFGKGVGKFLWFPTEGTFRTVKEVSDGLVKAPTLWDKHYKPREQKHISSFKNGVMEFGKSTVMGVGEGFRDLVYKPIQYGREEGALGVAKGTGIGVANFIWQPMAGALRGVESLGRGAYMEVVRKGRMEGKKLEGTTGCGDWREAASELSGYDAGECERILGEFLRVPKRG